MASKATTCHSNSKSFDLTTKAKYKFYVSKSPQRTIFDTTCVNSTSESWFLPPAGNSIYEYHFIVQNDVPTYLSNQQVENVWGRFISTQLMPGRPASRLRWLVNTSFMLCPLINPITTAWYSVRSNVIYHYLSNSFCFCHYYCSYMNSCLLFH